MQGSLLGTALAFNNGTLIEQAVIQADREATGNRGQTSAPSDAFQCKDGWIIVQVVGQPLFERWARLMGENTWLTDERFKDDISRGDHGEIISERMQRWCAERTRQEAIEALETARIPVGHIYKPAETLADPHVIEAGFMKPIEYPGMKGTAPVVDLHVKLSKTPGGVRRRPPTLGEHTIEIMQELGYSEADIDSLKEKRVV